MKWDIQFTEFNDELLIWQEIHRTSNKTKHNKIYLTYFQPHKVEEYNNGIPYRIYIENGENQFFDKKEIKNLMLEPWFKQNVVYNKGWGYFRTNDLGKAVELISAVKEAINEMYIKRS